MLLHTNLLKWSAADGQPLTSCYERFCVFPHLQSRRKGKTFFFHEDSVQSDRAASYFVESTLGKQPSLRKERVEGGSSLLTQCCCCMHAK